MSYTITIDSLNGTGDDGNKTYTIDWSFLKDNQEYDMTFSYRSTQPTKFVSVLAPGGGEGGELYVKMPNLVMDYAYETSGSGSVSSDIVGMVRPSVNISPPNSGSNYDQNGDYLQYETPNNFNAPIRCKKPTGSSFNVKIFAVGVDETGEYDPTSRPELDNDAQSYIMILHFKRVSQF
jgi:hypothetical protein